MYGNLKKHLAEELRSIEDAGLYKNERIINSSQDAVIRISTGEEVINFCANNYLGLSNNKEVIQAAKDTMDTHGYGMSSVRFICGTQDIHKALSEKGIEVDRHIIGLDEPIKALGVYDVPIKVTEELQPNIKLYVIKA